MEPSDTDMENAVDVAGAEGDDMLDIIIGITRLERKSTVEPDFPHAHMIHACCGNYKYTLSCNIALAPEEEEDSEEESEERYLPVDNLICTTVSGMVYTDLGR